MGVMKPASGLVSVAAVGGWGVMGGDSVRKGSQRVRHCGDLMKRGRMSPAISFSVQTIMESNRDCVTGAGASGATAACSSVRNDSLTLISSSQGGVRYCNGGNGSKNRGTVTVK